MKGSSISADPSLYVNWLKTQSILHVSKSGQPSMGYEQGEPDNRSCTYALLDGEQKKI